MASVAQIEANRLNAQKSTGPRTAAGKERASQNALKHGLLAREAVIQGEDPEEFECYRESMLQELVPAGVVQAMLAERIVGLSWRLLRAQRLQNAAFAALDEGEGEPTELLEARQEEWKQLKGNAWERSIAGVVDEDAALGRVVVEDFAGARVLDRLLTYERRIESSLYRTMAQLRREREARAAAEPKEVSRSEGGLAADQEATGPTKLGSFGVSRHGQTSLSVAPTRVDRLAHTLSHSEGDVVAGQECTAPAELGSFGADVGAEEVSSVRCQVSSAEGPASSGDSDFTLPTSHFKLPQITPYGVTTNAVDADAAGTGHLGQIHGRDARATGAPGGVGADPPAAGVDCHCGIPSLPRSGPAADVAAGEQSCETKPIRREFQV